MRRAALGVPSLQLGDRVYYTHRATSMMTGGAALEASREPGKQHTGSPRDLLRADRSRQRQRTPWVRTDYGEVHPALVHRSPLVRGRALHRWVYVWPEAGYGTIVGATTRNSGWITPGTHYSSDYGGGEEYDQGYLTTHVCYPMYEVKERLRGRPMLVPPWACHPTLPEVAGRAGVYRAALRGDEPWYGSSRGMHTHEQVVNAWLRGSWEETAT